ncbi:MAG: CRISPR-associated endonuclease Cas2 [Candidatus Methanospirare jalkutatii]|nr:CRISPR-associated endonuclease Cas2 [Candidatus Methanospirare jalkutatii]
MYVIIVYDVNVERVAKIYHYLLKYLDWVQNSVFEGELTDSQLQRIKHDIKRIINEGEDSVRLYIFRTKDQLKTETIGVEKRSISTII